MTRGKREKGGGSRGGKRKTQTDRIRLDYRGLTCSAPGFGAQANINCGLCHSHGTVSCIYPGGIGK